MGVDLSPKNQEINNQNFKILYRPVDYNFEDQIIYDKNVVEKLYLLQKIKEEAVKVENFEKALKVKL